MQEGLTQPPQSIEQPGQNNGSERALSQAEIIAQRQRTITQLQKLRLLQPDWTSKKGVSRDAAIALCEQELEHLDELEAAPPQSESRPTTTGAVPPPEIAITPTRVEAIPVPAPIVPQTSPRERFDDAAHYLTVGKTHIPICEPPRDSAQWEAVPGKVFVSGGKKFSEVRFIKDARGLSYQAKPGELLTFSEKRRGERLQSVDTILEGRDEVKAFNEILGFLAHAISEYEQLNHDLPDYDAQASELASRIDSFTRPDGVKFLKSYPRGAKMIERIDDPDDFAERVAEIIRTVQFLRSIDENGTDFIPEQDGGFKLTPHFQERFEWLAKLLNRQLGLGNNAYLKELVENSRAPQWERLAAKGMAIIVGPRGSGKNELVDYYCAQTNRPLLRYTCSPSKEERDLTYDVELSDGEVVRIPTRILTAMTTPNAVLELDEINLLEPAVAKFFNSLFDGDRAVFLNDQVIKAAPGVLFIGLMNPAGYDGVSDLPETIDDRSNAMIMPYIPFKRIDPTTNRERFTADEALILKEQIQPLKRFSDEEFTRLWDAVINNVGTKASLDDIAIKIFKDLKNLIAIADRTRQVVAAYKTRSGETRMERDISLRGSIDAAQFYSENHLWETDIAKLPDAKPGWNAAQYAVAMTYLPHTETYKRGKNDREALQLILAEGIK